MNILLTGSSGFLGKILFNNIEFNNIKTLSRHNSDYNLDLTTTIPDFKEKFDIVIHAAGKAHSIPETEEQSSKFFFINVNGTKNLLEGFKMNHIPKQFVYISSVSVYGLNKGSNINEDSALLANDPYGKSKIQAEEIISKWCQANDVTCTILRLPLIVGANPPGNLGSMIQGIKKGYYFNIAGGNAKKSMVLASDIAKFIFNAAEVGGIYNLTDGVHPTFNQLSRCVAQNLDKSFVPNMPLFIACLLAKLGDIFGNTFPINSNKLFKITSTLTFDDTKARISFAWNPTPVLEGFKPYEDA